MSNKLVILGLDGATWSQFDKFIQMGKMPKFEKIIKKGVKGELKSVFPFTSGTSWTSLITGTNAGKHGIPHHIVGGKREVDSIWQILSRKNLKCLVVNEVVTYPPEQINGVMITGGFSTPSDSKNFCYPPELLQKINDISKGYFPSLGNEVFDRVQKGDFEYFFNKLEEYGNNVSKVSLKLSQEYEWDVFSTIIENTDYLHHFFWNKEDYLEKFYCWLDNIIEKFYLVASKNNANLFLVSDHGFGPIKKYFLINSWLNENNFTHFEEPGKVRKYLSNTNIKRNAVRKGLDKIHLRKVVSKITPSELKKMVPIEKMETGIIQQNSKIFSEAYNEIIVKIGDKNEYEKVRNEIIEKLLSFEDKGKKVVKEAHKREEIFEGPYTSRAYDIQFLLNEGYCWSPSIREKSLIAMEQFNKTRSGDHRPEGIFVGIGPDIIENKILKEPLIMWDVSPTILHMFDLDIPSYMDGIVRKSIFSERSHAHKKMISKSQNSEKEELKKKILQKRSRLRL